ncbi:MAG: hypothetical protein H6773_00150 [Pseudomonadales bacterium]|nr:hypothetical protein [Candidatus Woesebacteria bacterium]MCB9800584.1 hypothetical protein [Pseudomonadales bacterium]
MIIPVYKPLGASSHQLAAKIGLARGEKATHTGTLDPLAEGVLVVLTGEDRFKKVELSNTQKTYVFEIVFGLTTDTHDLLGLPTGIRKSQLELQNIETALKVALPGFLGKSQQLQPNFSAGRHNGKSFFELAKKNQNTFPKIKNSITIYSLTLVESSLISRKKLLEKHVERVSLVTGDFRQKEILAAWQRIAKQLPAMLPLFHLEATVSKRTYIRALVRDLSQTLTIPATTFSIVRLKNGAYSTEDCTPQT